jgi:hypothetical protein
MSVADLQQCPFGAWRLRGGTTRPWLRWRIYRLRSSRHYYMKSSWRIVREVWLLPSAVIVNVLITTVVHSYAQCAYGVHEWRSPSSYTLLWAPQACIFDELNYKREARPYWESLSSLMTGNLRICVGFRFLNTAHSSSSFVGEKPMTQIGASVLSDTCRLFQYSEKDLDFKGIQCRTRVQSQSWSWWC